MNAKQFLIVCGFIFGCSACMGQTRPAPDTSPLPTSASIAEQAGTDARRLDAERRSGVIFESSKPGEILIDGQAPVPEMPPKPESLPAKQPESVPTESEPSDETPSEEAPAKE